MEAEGDERLCIMFTTDFSVSAMFMMMKQGLSTLEASHFFFVVDGIYFSKSILKTRTVECEFVFIRVSTYGTLSWKVRHEKVQKIFVHMQGIDFF